jgi:iron complex transport system substrate-binding protein
MAAFLKLNFRRFKQIGYLPGCILLLFFVACNNRSENTDVRFPELKQDTGIKYARRFAISDSKHFSVVYLFGNRNNAKDTTASYIVFSDSSSLPPLPSNMSRIRIPCRRIAALSCIYATMLCELGCIDNIAAIDNIDYVNNPLVSDKFNRGALKELARTPQIDLEKTIVLNPDIIFTYGMGEWEKDTDEKLERTKIPVAISVDHLEESPLARAEWIKFFGLFVNQRARADSIFKKVEKNYFELKAVAGKTTARPTVFNEIKYSDSWYMPGGKSYVAQLLNDAGADYLWKDDDRFGSLPLSFEQVFARARDADFWINLSTVKTKKELLSYESRYAQFKAFQKGNLYNNTKVTNKYGYSNYWETGMVHPDRILSDLILIFHPEQKSRIGNELYYYEKIE